MMRSLGALRALENTLGAPEKIVASGPAAMLGCVYAHCGLDKTIDFFQKRFNELVSLFSFDFYEGTENLNAIGFNRADIGITLSDTYRKLTDFYTLIKSGTSGRYLGIDDIKKIDKYLETTFGFLSGHMLKIPCYTSLFNYETAQEKVVSITTIEELKAGISIVPFMGPVEIDSFKYISIQNIQGLPSPIKDRRSDLHIVLDTLSENGTPPFLSSMYILIAADYMGTIELKKQIEKEFSMDINLWDNPEYRKNIDYSHLIEEGYKTAGTHLKKLFKKLRT